MAKATTRTRTRPATRRSPGRRPDARRSTSPVVGWVRRNPLWAGGLAAVVVAAVVLAVVALAGGGGGGDEGGPGGLTGADFHSLVVDPADPERIFVGGHQAVSVSTDGGATWAEVDSLRDADAMGWAFTGDAVYVSGHPGLNTSTDGGETFERTNEGLPSTDVHALGGTDEVLYGASPAVGVFASAGGSDEWEVLTTAAGQGFFGRIIVDPADDRHLLAPDASVGVAESRDGGATWTVVDSGLPAATWLSRGGDGPDLLVASGPAGAAVSRDGGQTWEPLELPAGALLVEAIPGQPDLLYTGTHDGSRVQVQVSRDGGRTWSTPEPTTASG